MKILMYIGPLHLQETKVAQNLSLHLQMSFHLQETKNRPFQQTSALNEEFRRNKN